MKFEVFAGHTCMASVVTKTNNNSLPSRGRSPYQRLEGGCKKTPYLEHVKQYETSMLGAANRNGSGFSDQKFNANQLQRFNKATERYCTASSGHWSKQSSIRVLSRWYTDIPAADKEFTANIMKSVPFCSKSREEINSSQQERTHWSLYYTLNEKCKLTFFTDFPVSFSYVPKFTHILKCTLTRKCITTSTASCLIWFHRPTGCLSCFHLFKSLPNPYLVVKQYLRSSVDDER